MKKVGYYSDTFALIDLCIFLALDSLSTKHATFKNQKGQRASSSNLCVLLLPIAAYGFDRVDEFDTSSLAWNNLEAFGSKPSPREDESLTVVQGDIFVFGGYDTVSNLNRKF